MIRTKLTSILTVLLAFTLHAEIQEADYPYTKALTLQPSTNNSAKFGSFEVDEEIFSKLKMKIRRFIQVV